ncbi:hypothetical protein L596_010222 [Steinernema carpocapsae]|uniref:Uncharacterized protein n=1 Tax=Steinernema carpocapsae TaxID=34508 RepID=A0A4U5PIF5_STECR|nr:hypothetical protein L596_010222 [Steinernema carpocapsae]
MICQIIAKPGFFLEGQSDAVIARSRAIAAKIQSRPNLRRLCSAELQCHLFWPASADITITTTTVDHSTDT